MHEALHGRRALLHRWQMSGNRVRLRVVGSFGRVVSFIAMTLFVGATHIISPALLFGPPSILHATLIKTPNFR
jgi:hypothetical protein